MKQHRFRAVVCAALCGLVGAGGGGGAESLVPYCHDPNSFLGVANAKCLAANQATTFMLLGLIVVISIGFETLIHRLHHKYADSPQLLTLVDHVIEELMILGFISMTFFAMNTIKFSGETITSYLSRFNADMGPTELFHFKEFFHYLIFLAMMYYLAVVLIMIWSSHMLPKLWNKFETQLQQGDAQLSAWRASEQQARESEHRARLEAGGSSLLGGNPTSSSSSSSSSSSTASMAVARASEGDVPVDQVTEDYCNEKEARRMYGWRVKANPLHWARWWLLVNRMAYKLARESSREIYEDRELIEVAFGLPLYSDVVVDYSFYAVLSTRAVLIKMCEIHWSAWAVLLLFVICNEFRVRLGGTKALHEDDAETVQSVIMSGFTLFGFACVLCAKTFQVLQGIVNDRVLIFYRNGKIQRLVLNNSVDEEEVNAASNSGGERSSGRPSANARRNSTAVAKKRLQKLDFHCRRFWLGKPKLLVRLLTFVTFFTAIFMAVLSLMFVTMGKKVWGGLGLFCMMLWPLLICTVVLPATLPVLAHTLDLCGYLGADQLEKLQSRHDHAHLKHSEKRAVRFCPFCGSEDIVMNEARLCCANCGTDGISAKVKVQSTSPHHHVPTTRSAGTKMALKAVTLGGQALVGGAKMTGKVMTAGVAGGRNAARGMGKVAQKGMGHAQSWRDSISTSSRHNKRAAKDSTAEH